MDATLKEWLLSRGVAEKTVSILEKEEIVSIDVFSRLREEDLTALKNDHGLSLGEHVRLRDSRDALLRRARESPTSRSEGSAAKVTDKGGNGERACAERGVESIPPPQSAKGGLGKEGGPPDGKQGEQNR